MARTIAPDPERAARLRAAIDDIVPRLAAVPRIRGGGPGGSDWIASHNAHRQAAAALAVHIRHAHGARVHIGLSDAHRLRLHGISVSCTRGVQVRCDGKPRNVRINRLVCEAFHGAPKIGEHARHLNGDSLNNKEGDLAWGSAARNYHDQVRAGTARRGPLPSQSIGLARKIAAQPGTTENSARKLILRRQAPGLSGPLLWQDYGNFT